eukprot:CAMPEP_0175129142 /NCGR_PEP_ID=MMETSP0087-20121206/5310_1 /TAXON_ID=136419 /ORGANISM="Unknown Unknown, Strain D1" /LENGTH=76 /DNA_ID=CAMNT_0016411263 /DNA_START=182 /DNA_END=412 /DNA_ORIENTATION=-
MSTRTPSTDVTPSLWEERAAWAAWAHLISALDGTHPLQVQSPPTLFFSTKATLKFKSAAKDAAVNPPDPAPTTTRS